FSITVFPLCLSLSLYPPSLHLSLPLSFSLSPFSPSLYPLSPPLSLPLFSSFPLFLSIPTSTFSICLSLTSLSEMYCNWCMGVSPRSPSGTHMDTQTYNTSPHTHTNTHTHTHTHTHADKVY